MKNIRIIYDTARDAAMNMAIDEILFENLQNEPVLRIYFWDKEYATIGYFQKNECNAIRRLTGGLLVNHKNDLSYSFCACAEEWPHLYSQQDTYRHIHSAIKKALLNINIDSKFAELEQPVEKNMLCVQTLYSDDLLFEGKKIAGSCMRRRGRKILVQGSVHLDLGNARKKEFSLSFAENMAEMLSLSIKQDNISESELEQAAALSAEKYSDVQWNNKF